MLGCACGPAQPPPPPRPSAQGGETKRMFRVLGLQAGDALKLTLQGKSSGIPTTRLAIIPAGAHEPALPQAAGLKPGAPNERPS